MCQSMDKEMVLEALIFFPGMLSQNTRESGGGDFGGVVVRPLAFHL